MNRKQVFDIRKIRFYNKRIGRLYSDTLIIFPEEVSRALKRMFSKGYPARLIWPLTFMLPSSMRAAGDVRFAMVTSVISMFVFRLGAAYLLALTFDLGALGVWFAMLFDWGFRAVVFSFRWLSGGWKNKSIIQSTI